MNSTSFRLESRWASEGGRRAGSFPAPAQRSRSCQGRIVLSRSGPVLKHGRKVTVGKGLNEA